MNRFALRIGVSAAVVLLSAAHGVAASVSIPASARGWYFQSGFRNLGSQSYFTGHCGNCGPFNGE